ncbi:MAG: glucosaminidase domain-containing protein [Flavisolibacter sp.]
MKKLRLLAIILFALASSPSYAQSSEKIRNYIETYKEIAIQEMQRTGVPASITLAQGIHETGAGTSDLVARSNNHFGIKCKTEWSGQRVYHDDDARGECFRKYDDPFESYRDHSDFLKYRPYYTSLFQLDPTDYKSWAQGLKKAGYATNPKYAQILIKLIEDYNLQDYTLLAMNNQPGKTLVFASNTVKTESGEIVALEEEVIPQVQKNYPTGLFRINQADVLYVTKGTSFLAVADRNNVSLSRMFEFNDMKATDIAERDQLMFLQRKRKTGATEFHIVVAGESLYDIAQDEGIRLESLLDYNKLKQHMQPKPGEKLYLQTKAPEMPQLISTQKKQLSTTVDQRSVLQHTNNFIFHIVQPKETVYAISKKYAVQVEDLMKWNDMQTIALKTGQQLRIGKKTSNAN